MGFRSIKGFSSRGRLFQSVRAADTSTIHYSLFSIIYYLTPPLAPSDDTGFRHPPLAPSDEGAVSEADWGREPGISFPQRRENGAANSLPPALRATSLIRGRLALLLFQYAGGTPHQREAWVSALPMRRWNPSSEGGLRFGFSLTLVKPRQREAWVSALSLRRWTPLRGRIHNACPGNRIQGSPDNCTPRHRMPGGVDFYCS